jgi:hypothetical protein
MDFSITSRYKDCLSRQIGEALRINYTKDIILNSKGEYLSNSISRLSIEEDAWERKERSRVEEEQDKLIKEEVERFRRLKTSNQLEELVSTNGGPCHLYGGGAPQEQINTRACGQYSQSSLQKDTSSESGPQEEDAHDHLLYETDDEEFEGDDEASTGGPCRLYGGGPPHQQRNTWACGQFSQSSRTSLQEVSASGSIHQDDDVDDNEHLLYETDEEEFEDTIGPYTGGPCHLYGGGAPHHQTNTRACGQSSQSNLQEDTTTPDQPHPGKKKKKTSTSTKDYNLNYFTLWWSRMTREGLKEESVRKRRDEDAINSVRLRQLLLVAREPKPDPDIIPAPRTLEMCTIVENENDDAICERPDCGKTLPDLSDNDCLVNVVGGRDIDVCDGGNPRISKKMRHSQGFGGGTEADIVSYLQERTQASSIQCENTTSGDFKSAVDRI